MTVLKRSDGTPFILRCYREQFLDKNSNDIRRECRILSQTNGLYLRVFTLGSSQAEAVFSHEPGYLYAETLLAHFGKIDNLLYCEALPDDTVVLILVKHGTIHYDAQLAKSALQTELSALLTDETVYTVKLYGDLSINSDYAESIIINENQIRALDTNPTGLFNLLKRQEKFRLLPIEQAVTKIKSISLLPVMAFLLLFIAMGLWLYDDDTAQIPQNHMQVTSWTLARHALMSPAPHDQLAAIYDAFIQSNAVPGWDVTQISYQPDESLLTLHSIGAPTAWLLGWANHRHYQIALTSDGAKVHIPAHVRPRQAPRHQVKRIDTLSKLIDRMMRVIPDKSITIRQQSLQPYKVTPVELSLHELSPQAFKIVTEMLQGLALQLQHVNLNVNKGLLSGTIKLKVIGS